MGTHRRRATYTYAIARPFHPAHLWGVRGVDGAAAHLVHHDDLVAVVSTLRGTEADEAVLRSRLADREACECVAGESPDRLPELA
jgi:hypothetical protein